MKATATYFIRQADEPPESAISTSSQRTLHEGPLPLHDGQSLQGSASFDNSAPSAATHIPPLPIKARLAWMKRLFIFSISFLIARCGHSQVMMNLQLPPAGLTVKDQLWNLSLVNPGPSDIYVRLEMQLSDVSTDQRILTAVTREFVLPQGVKQVRPADILPVTYNVINTAYPVDISPSGFLPVGVFNVCYTVVQAGAHSERLSDECATVEVEPVSPPELVFPSNDETVEEPRPLFTWVPPAPLHLFNRLSYDFTLVEVLPSQSPSDAVTANIPVCMVPDVQGTSLQYPYSLAELDTAKTYAWRVKANNDHRTVANSDIWTFHIENGKLAGETPKSRASYVKLSRRQDASSVVCNGALYYEYTSEFNDTAVSIAIYDITKAERKKLALTPAPAGMNYGVNFGNIDLTQSREMVDKHIYLLELTNAKQEKWYVKFRFSKS